MQFALAWGRGLTPLPGSACATRTKGANRLLPRSLSNANNSDQTSWGWSSFSGKGIVESDPVCSHGSLSHAMLSAGSAAGPCAPSLLRPCGRDSRDREGQTGFGENPLKAGASTAQEELDGSSTLRSRPLLPVHPVLPVQGLQQASCQQGVASDDALGANREYHFQKVCPVFAPSSVFARCCAPCSTGWHPGRCPSATGGCQGLGGASWRWRSRGWH